MKLFINTSARDRVIIELDGKSYEAPVRADKSQRLMPFILKELGALNKTLQDLTEIEVFTGPGSFTGLRIGVSVAQSLAWSLKIPLNGKLVDGKHVIQINYETQKLT